MDAQERIRQLQQERGWSDYRLAKESGLSMSTIANLFRRNTIPKVSTLETICQGLGITMAQFFTDEEELVPLTPEQKEMFQKWALLSKDQKKLIFDLINNMK